MAFTGTFLCSSFKAELLKGVHDFTTHVFKLALYTADATIDATTTAYSATNEIGDSGDYSAGGVTLTATTPTLDGTTAIVDFSDVSIGSLTASPRGALIYNSTASGNPAVAVLDFGSEKSVSNQTLSISFPVADADDGIVRIA